VRAEEELQHHQQTFATLQGQWQLSMASEVSALWAK
jgi:hypothetical protein